MRQTPVKDRVSKLRQEIAEIAHENRIFVNRLSRLPAATAEHERRLQRLKEIMDELKGLTDPKEPCALGETGPGSPDCILTFIVLKVKSSDLI